MSPFVISTVAAAVPLVFTCRSLMLYKAPLPDKFSPVVSAQDAGQPIVPL